MTVTSKIGFGGKVTGEVTVVSGSLDGDASGKIVVSLVFVGREFLEKAGLIGVAAVVVPSMHYRDFAYFQSLNEFPILVLLKFGKLELAGELAEKLEKLDGKKAVLDGKAHELQAD